LTLAVIDIERFEQEPHCWFAVAPVVGEKWVENLAKKYRELRTESIVPLSDIVLDGVTVLYKKDLEERLARAVIPDRASGVLSVARSDFGETISYCLLEEHYGTRIAYKSIRDRELIQLAGRGIDAIGVECSDEQPLHLVLCETKTSTEQRSPPQVVDSAQESLRAQHKKHLSDLEATLRKVWDAARRARDKETQELLFAAGLYLQDERWDMLRLVAYSCLVRPRALYKSTDYGSFREKPSDFYPSKVRFTAFCVPSDDIEAVVDEWLQLAKVGEETE